MSFCGDFSSHRSEFSSLPPMFTTKVHVKENERPYGMIPSPLLETRLLQLAARVGLGFSMFSVPRVEPNWGTGLRETKLIVSRGARR